MRKHPWTVIAGICLILLVTTSAFLVLRGSAPSTGDIHETVVPAHWWRLDMNDEQLQILKSLWGRPISALKLTEEIWPDIVDEIPSFPKGLLEIRNVSWPSKPFEEWVRIQATGGGKGSYNDAGEFYLSEIYIGRKSSETPSFGRSDTNPIVADRVYRISFYTDDVLPKPQ